MKQYIYALKEIKYIFSKNDYSIMVRLLEIAKYTEKKLDIFFIVLNAIAST